MANVPVIIPNIRPLKLLKTDMCIGVKTWQKLLIVVMLPMVTIIPRGISKECLLFFLKK